MERLDVDESVERLLAELIGGALARTIMRQAHGRATGPAHAPGHDASSTRAFVRGPLLDVLAPLVGRGEASRMAYKIECSLAAERNWPIPEEYTLPGARRTAGSDPRREGPNER